MMGPQQSTRYIVEERYLEKSESSGKGSMYRVEGSCKKFI